MVELKTPAEIEKMAVAGRFVAETLRDLCQQARPGVNLLEIEHRARRCLRRRGAVSPYWDYAPSFGRGPFRNVICLSVNDAALHGLPRDHELRDGDVLSLDLAVSVDGWVADSTVTVIVGTAREDDLRLVRSTREALAAGIEAAVPGARLGDVSAAIGEVAARYGYLPNKDFGGHGVGRSMHEDPHVPNHGRPGRGLRLRPGLTLALEPWWAASTDALAVDPDGWTLRSADGSRCAHAEHTIAVTDDRPRVLTSTEPGS
jgi:methionyl aminopeptidase